MIYQCNKCQTVWDSKTYTEPECPCCFGEFYTCLANEPKPKPGWTQPVKATRFNRFGLKKKDVIRKFRGNQPSSW